MCLFITIISLCTCKGAGEAPGNVKAETVSSTEISVQWSGLSDCRLVNGRITSYRVQFTATDRTETRDQELRDGEDWRSGGEMLLTQLTPITTYSIAVAAVNENGDVGLFSDSVTIQVKQGTHFSICGSGIKMLYPLQMKVHKDALQVARYYYYHRRFD